MHYEKREMPKLSTTHELTQNLPSFCHAHSPPDNDYRLVIKSAYDQVVHWKSNLFPLPMGNVAAQFVMKLAKFFDIYALESAQEDSAIMSAMLFPSLILQRPHYKSKPREHIDCLERRLPLWGTADGIRELLKEGNCIQRHLPLNQRNTRKNNQKDNRSRRFTQFMTKGKVKDAIRCLSTTGGGRVLNLSDVITEGSDKGWCTCYGKNSVTLCRSLASFGRRICSNYVDPSCLTAFNACRLIPLDKLPGVRPIGVVEVCRRIIGKAVMKIVKLDVMESVAGRQFCAGLNGGCEAAVHCMSTVFELNEASLFVDATNAFNSLNRATTLINLPNICPALAPILINTYRDPVSLFVNGETLTSKEGTTQARKPTGNGYVRNQNPAPD